MEEDGVSGGKKTAFVRSVPSLSKSLLSHPTVMLLEVSVPSAGDSCAHLSRAALSLRADLLRTLNLPGCVPGLVLGVLPGCSFFPRH